MHVTIEHGQREKLFKKKFWGNDHYGTVYTVTAKVRFDDKERAAINRAKLRWYQVWESPEFIDYDHITNGPLKRRWYIRVLHLETDWVVFEPLTPAEATVGAESFVIALKKFKEHLDFLDRPVERRMSFEL